jgi:hypothetical protein
MVYKRPAVADCHDSDDEGIFDENGNFKSHLTKSQPTESNSRKAESRGASAKPEPEHGPTDLPPFGFGNCASGGADFAAQGSSIFDRAEQRAVERDAGAQKFGAANGASASNLFGQYFTSASPSAANPGQWRGVGTSGSGSGAGSGSGGGFSFSKSASAPSPFSGGDFTRPISPNPFGFPQSLFGSQPIQQPNPNTTPGKTFHEPIYDAINGKELSSREAEILKSVRKVDGCATNTQKSTSDLKR